MAQSQGGDRRSTAVGVSRGEVLLLLLVANSLLNLLLLDGRFLGGSFRRYGRFGTAGLLQAAVAVHRRGRSTAAAAALDTCSKSGSAASCGFNDDE